MDAVDSTHVLDYYARHFRPGMVDLSTSSPSGPAELDEQRVGYGPPGGLPALREAIASLYPGLAAEHVVVTNGATEALAATAFALLGHLCFYLPASILGGVCLLVWRLRRESR